MYYLRTLLIRDVLRALKRGEPYLALRISHNLCGNAINAAAFRLRTRLPIRSGARRSPSPFNRQHPGPSGSPEVSLFQLPSLFN